MAEDKVEPREFNLRQWLPWTVLFRGFQVAMDPKKLLLAAAGIVVMAFGWWLLAVVFYGPRNKPHWDSGKYEPREFKPTPGVTEETPGELNAWKAFKRDRRAYNLIYRAAAPNDGPREKMDAGDLAETLDDFKIIDPQIKAGKPAVEIPAKDGSRPRIIPVPEKSVRGELREWPWFQYRGQNPYLMVAGLRGYVDESGIYHVTPWRRAQFFDWLLGTQIPVLLEPLVKFLKPVFYLLHSDAGFLEHLYFLLVALWTVGTWAIFGGAITRMAAVQLARNEKVGLGDALRFVWTRKWSYFFASVAPMLFVGAVAFFLFLFGIGNLIPIFAEFWDGLLFPLLLLGGLAMAVILVGMVGWPMIHATLSTEGSDSFDALSRSYSYVYQAIWNYLWYAAVALVYGVAIVFFVSFMGSLMVYLGKWGMTQTIGTEYFNRNPSYMFVWAPTSYEWRSMLTEGPAAAANSSADLISRENFYAWNWIGTFLVTVWTYLVFLMMIGFAYSYFWCQSTTIYLLMRRKVDDTELDEVYLEEEEPEDTYSTSVSTPAPSLAAGGTPLAMVEPPALRPSAPGSPSPAPPSPPPTAASVASPGAASEPGTPPSEGDGNAPPAQP